MIVEALNIAIMLSLIFMAGLLWHNGIPAAQRDGKVKAIEILLLGLVMSFNGIGRLSVFLAAPQSISFYTFGNLALIAYAWLRYRRLLLKGKAFWWSGK